MKKILTIALLALTIAASACWFTAADWQVVWIDSVNNTSITPVFGTFPTVTAAECGTINIPATVRVKITPSVTNATPILETRLQWKHSASTTWKTICELKDLDWALDYSTPIAIFGTYNFNPPGVKTGDVVLIRLQVEDATTVNAQIDVDTTAEGTNGWQDQWVTSMTIGIRR